MFKTIMTIWGVVIVVGGIVIGTSTLNSQSAPSAPVSIPAPAAPVHQKPISVDYKEVARYPERYVGKAVVFAGKAVQVLYESNSVFMRVVVSKDGRGSLIYENIVLVGYRDPLKSDGRILENDFVEFHGIFKGTQNYKALFGQSIDKPSVAACDVVVFSNPRVLRDCT